MKLTFDFECTITNKGNPFTKCNQAVSYSYKIEDSPAKFHYFNEPDFVTALRAVFAEATWLIGVNLKFDLHWAQRLGIRPPKGVRVWDCQLAEFIMSGQTTSFPSMDSLCEKYGIPGKEDAVSQFWEQGVDTTDIPVDILKEYGNGDVDRTWKIFQAQLQDPRMTPAIHKLILLDGADLLVLQKMEWNGLKYDAEKSRAEADHLRTEFTRVTDYLTGLVPCPQDFNWDSGDHLSAFLYGGSLVFERYETVELTYKSGPRKGEQYTRNKKIGEDVYKFPGIFKPLRNSKVARSTPERPLYSTAEPILKQLGQKSKVQKQIIECLLKRAELGKLIDTYFVALPNLIEKMEWEDGIIHGQYNQVVARTGRLSSSKPNMQNNPEAVDRMFVSRYV